MCRFGVVVGVVVGGVVVGVVYGRWHCVLFYGTEDSDK